MIKFNLYQSTMFYLSNFDCPKRFIPNFKIYRKLNEEG